MGPRSAVTSPGERGECAARTDRRYALGMPPGAFYTRDGERFVPTALTPGPWDPKAQHGGPVAALIGRAIERCSPREDFFIGRMTEEILGPVGMAPIEVTAQVGRPGRSVELIEAQLIAGGRPVARANAWRMRGAASPEGVGTDPHTLPPGPEDAEPMQHTMWGDAPGYWTAMDWRVVARVLHHACAGGRWAPEAGPRGRSW